MSERSKPGPPEDSLDRVERIMAIEEALIDQVQADPRLDAAQREWLIREIEARIDRGEFGDEGDFDDDALGSLVRKYGPRSPHGQGTMAQPEEPFFE